jgi:hypothetical protein
MKRKTKPWQEKVDPYCLKYLEVYGEARRLMAKLPEPSDLRSLAKWPKPVREIFERHPELSKTKRICLKPEFVQMLESVPSFRGMVMVGEHVYPAQMADILEMMQDIVLFPSFTPEVKMGGYFWLALGIVTLKDILGQMWRQQYGAEPLDETKIATLAAQFFEMLAQLCRGRIPQTKGRHNLELVGLVKMIQEHQKEVMTPHDLREALTAGGVAVPEGETFRIWLWRARKDGLIPRSPAGSRGRLKKP